ncbi:MAG: hypothetical protein HC945_01605 [Nitrosarchaeum sp.]|nr:hypothetical protein [Nitrosarchaeum sp.]
MMRMGTTLVVLVLGLVVLGGAALAGPWGSQGSGMQQRGGGPSGAYHERMEEVLSSGSYADLLSLREELGVTLAPWVQDEEGFAALQERHEQGALVRDRLALLAQSGSYADLVELREEVGRDVLRFIQSDEDLEEWRASGGSLGPQKRGLGRGGMHGGGHAGFGRMHGGSGCPLMG